MIKPTVFLDSSHESDLLRRALLRSKLPVKFVFQHGHNSNLPAIESEFGMIHGWANIKICYQLPLD